MSELNEMLEIYGLPEISFFYDVDDSSCKGAVLSSRRHNISRLTLFFFELPANNFLGLNFKLKML